MTLASQQRHLARIIFHGAILYLDGRAALYWPKNRCLVVSDLHLGKGRAFDTLGFNLPQYDTDETLERLETLLNLYEPDEVILLGDSFHNVQSWSMLSRVHQQKLQQILGAVPRCKWILGNHDPSIPEALPGSSHLWLDYAPVRLTHDLPTTSENTSPIILGHFHPKARIPLVRRSLRAPCFVITSQQIILPAFGSFTGGLDLDSKEFSKSFEVLQIFACYREKIWQLDHSQIKSPGSKPRKCDN